MKNALFSTLLAAVALTIFVPLAQAHEHKVCNWDHHHHRVCHWVH
ncbi:HHHH-motif protein [Paraburkholderia pallida]|nr:HHHH-motif protein [Paraburkholderia pallida]